MRFSIIIPVYNVEQYIRKCMDSIMNQSFSDFEVIVVDDETPDNSMQIVQEFVERYPDKIQVIHQKNTRQGGARNRGVLEARGEYILFVDSDDYVHTDMLQTVNTRLEETPCDILVFRFAGVSEKDELLWESDFKGLKPGLYHPSEYAQILRLHIGPVCKAFRRSFYVESGVRFPEKLLYEDGITRLLHAKASSVGICDDCLYYYVQSSQSTMRTGISERMLDILTITDIVRDGFQRDGLYDQFRDPLELSLIWGILGILNGINQRDPSHPLQIPLADYIAKTFPDYPANTEMSKKEKKELDLLVAHKFRRYHFWVFQIPHIKSQLLRCPFVAKLNQLRKRRK